MVRFQFPYLSFKCCDLCVITGDQIVLECGVVRDLGEDPFLYGVRYVHYADEETCEVEEFTGIEDLVVNEDFLQDRIFDFVKEFQPVDREGGEEMVMSEQ